MIFRGVRFDIAYGRSLRHGNKPARLSSSHEFHLSPNSDSAWNCGDRLRTVPHSRLLDDDNHATLGPDTCGLPLCQRGLGRRQDACVVNYSNPGELPAAAAPQVVAITDCHSYLFQLLLDEQAMTDG